MPLALLTANQTNQTCIDNISKAATIFTKYKIKVDEEIDGSDDANKETRGILFGISGEPGTYPQFFRRNGPEEFEFLCNGNQLIESEDCQDMLKDQVQSDPKFLEKNTQYMLIEEKFKDF